ncbi:MAG TPA: hypothetical protein VKA70_19235 [Blastocatellia bacterium]|nr:hypothetical protein [Blastocatellia bacterium]
MKRGVLIALALILMAGVMAMAAGSMKQRKASSDEAAADDTPSGERWEYLVVAGAHNNLSPSGNPNLRKENTGAFGREAFVLEQALDKLGAKGWELVSVSGSQGDPVYYFKRRR